MAVAAILIFIKNKILVKKSLIRFKTYLGLKFGENRCIGSKVIARYINPRWRSPPF
jgi:hypothetical protein